MDESRQGHEEDKPKKGPLDQTPEERAQARRRFEKMLEKEKRGFTMSTPLGALRVGRGDEKGFFEDDDEETPAALNDMRQIWQGRGQMGSKHDPSMAMPSAFKEESAGIAEQLRWEDLPGSGESTYDTGEAIRRAREAFRATLRREGKLRE